MKRFALFWLVALLLTAAVTAIATYLILNPNFSRQKESKAAFVLSFDDNYIQEWYRARPILDKYDTKATFFITLPHKINAEEKRMLDSLAADGHEIASHAYAHKNAPDVVEEHSLNEYVASEVVPSIKALNKLGYHPVSFAYPYGAHNRITDFELKKYFYLLRGDSWKVMNKGIHELDKIFYTYDGSRVINGLGIDNGSDIAIEELCQGFKRAKERKEAIVIYAHSIDNSGGKYSITPDRLEKILAAAREHELFSLRFKDLIL